MWRCKSSRLALAAVASLFLLALSAGAARAADMVDNPMYQAWSKHKVGSSQTLISERMMGADKLQLKITSTLVSVSPDEVKIQVEVQRDRNGKADGDPQKSTRAFPAKTETANVADKGSADVKAMDKTFKCKSFKLTGGALGKNEQGPPAPTTIFVVADVPGPVQKIEDEDGDLSTFVLTAMDVKK